MLVVQISLYYCWYKRNNAFHQISLFQVGNGATNAYQSNFFGYQAGNGATGASYSNFFGQLAGNQGCISIKLLVIMLVMVQQMLSTQILLVKRLVLVRTMEVLQIT
jgi:hypothetical protein